MSLPIEHSKGPSPRPTIGEVREAVTDFLMKQPDVRQVCVTKLAAIDAEKGSWEAEADIFVPNAIVKGLPVQREVLDSQSYLLRLDGCAVVAYGPRDSVAEGRSGE